MLNKRVMRGDSLMKRLRNTRRNNMYSRINEAFAGDEPVFASINVSLSTPIDVEIGEELTSDMFVDPNDDAIVELISLSDTVVVDDILDNDDYKFVASVSEPDSAASLYDWIIRYTDAKNDNVIEKYVAPGLIDLMNRNASIDETAYDDEVDNYDDLQEDTLGDVFDDDYVINGDEADDDYDDYDEADDDYDEADDDYFDDIDDTYVDDEYSDDVDDVDDEYSDDVDDVDDEYSDDVDDDYHTDAYNESVSSKFSKYRNLYESAINLLNEEDNNTDKDDNSSDDFADLFGDDDDSNDNNDDNKDDDNDDDNDDTDDDNEDVPMTAVVLTIKKDDVDKCKDEMISAGIPENDIEVVDTEDDDENAKLKVDANSVKELKDYLAKKGIDLEEKIGGEIIDDEDDSDDSDDSDEDDDSDNDDFDMTDLFGDDDDNDSDDADDDDK